MTAASWIVPIVEGDGEVQALPRLIHRLATAVGAVQAPQVNAPIRVKSGSFLHDGDYFRRYVALAAAKARQRPRGLVLVLLDCEDDCPAKLGPALRAQAQAVAPGVAIDVVLAHREYETWFLAAARSLAGAEGLPATLEPPPQPESIRNAKGWLARQMPSSYDPVVHQLRFTARFDVEAAREVASFDRFVSKVRRWTSVTEGAA